MRGWVAISVTATPAAAPRRIKEVLRIIIRELLAFVCGPPWAWIDGYPVLAEFHIKCTARPLWQRPIGLRRPLLRRARPLPRTAPKSRKTGFRRRHRHWGSRVNHNCVDDLLTEFAPLVADRIRSRA